MLQMPHFLVLFVLHVILCHMLGKNKIFGPKKKGTVREVVKELHNEELHALYCCHDVRVMKSIRTGC